MAAPSAFVADVHQFELELFQSQRRLIKSLTGENSAAFARYEARYRRTVRHAKRPVPFERLVAASRKARVTLVGDYHTHPQSQRAFFRVLRAQPADADVVVALEMILGRHQSAIDRFLAGRISERTFLKRIEHQRHWPFGPFDAVRPIFELARDRGWRVVGIDNFEGGTPLPERDHYAAARIAESLADAPKRRVLALLGEMHLAPGHLPRALRRAGVRSVLRVHQNPEPIWFDWAARGLATEHDVLEVGDDAFALLSASPVVCQQTYLTWLEQVQEGDLGGPVFDPNAGEANVHHAVQVIDRALSLGAKSALEDIEVVGPADLRFFDRLRRSGKFSKRELRLIRRHILSVESCYIPKARTIYLATLSVNHAAEEAAHMLRHYCSHEGIDETKGMVDAFYCRVMNEAIAFLGSKIVNPKRKCVHESDLGAMAAGDPDPMRATVAKFVVAHKRMERGEKVPQLAKVFRAAPPVFNAVTHMLGYILGDKLYYALSRGRVDRSAIRNLYFEPMEDEGAALLLYLEWANRVRRIRTPKRP